MSLKGFRSTCGIEGGEKVDVEIRRIIKNKDSYMITIPKAWAEEYLRISRFVALYRKKASGVIVIMPWLNTMEAENNDQD